jgi:alpha-1,6-mannosyltransferase
MLRQRVAFVDESVVALLWKMSIRFALIHCFTYPIITEDLWFSVVWGRMIVDSRNPYAEPFTPEDVTTGVPINVDFSRKDHFIRMTYGPLWAILSASLTLLSQQNIVIEFFYSNWC